MMRIAFIDHEQKRYGGLYWGIRNAILANEVAGIQCSLLTEPKSGYDYLVRSNIEYAVRTDIGLPYICHVHGWGWPQLKPGGGIDPRWARVLRNAKAVVASSQCLADHLAAQLRREVIPIWNCVDPVVFYAPKTQVLYPPELSGSLYVSTLTATFRKGIDRLSSLQVPIKVMGLSEPSPHLITKGQVSQTDLANNLRASMIFIHLSRYESCSLSIIEALSCGLPVVCTDVGDNREMIGKGGIIVDEPDIPSFVLEAIVQIETNYDQYRKGALRAAKSFRPQVIGKQWKQLWRSL